MGVPTSKVGYTPAMPRREDHEVHKGRVVALDKIYIYIYIYTHTHTHTLQLCILEDEVFVTDSRAVKADGYTVILRLIYVGASLGS